MAFKKPIIEMLEEMNMSLDEQSLVILSLLEKTRKGLPEKRIASKLDEKINATRKILYRLSSYGVVNYSKERDPKKKWWYIYFWFIDRDRIFDLYLEFKRKQLANINLQMLQEQKYVFECKECEKRKTFEQSIEDDYFCLDCGEVLTEIKDGKYMRKLKREANKIEKEIAELDIEKAKSAEKQVRKEAREAAKLAAEEEKKKKLAERKKAREAKKAGKPLPKKKAKPKPKKKAKAKPKKKAVKKKAKPKKKAVKKKAKPKKKQAKKKPAKKKAKAKPKKKAKPKPKKKAKKAPKKPTKKRKK